MDECCKIFIERFEKIIKRYFFPSTIFILIFFIFSFFTNNWEYFNTLKSLKNIWLIVLFIGLSYLLYLLDKIFYDNFLKNNFNYSDNDILNTLRKKIKSKLSKNEKEFINNDYLLYKYYSDKIQGDYIEEGKSIGYLFLSVILNIILFYQYKKCFNYNFFEIFLIIALWGCGLFLKMLIYRSRAIKLYLNLLKEE